MAEGGGIRTHGVLAGTTVFKTVTIDHSDTPPGFKQLYSYYNVTSISVEELGSGLIHLPKVALRYFRFELSSILYRGFYKLSATEI